VSQSTEPVLTITYQPRMTVSISNAHEVSRSEENWNRKLRIRKAPRLNGAFYPVLRFALDGRPATSTTRGVTVRPNRIKQIWRDGRFVTLGWLSVSHGFTAEVMARQGFDALCVDMQHGLTDMNDVWPMLQAISQTDTVPVVRVPWNDPATIMKALDLGAYGIIVPLINTAEDAAKAVAACRYPPVGMRSSGPVRAVHYGGADYLAKANDEIVVMAMIETKEGLANLDAICATKGLDAVYIGPADLSFALGLPPGPDKTDAVHMATCDKIRDAAHKHGIKAVMHCASAAFAAGAVKRGFDMVMLTSDLNSMIAGARRQLEELKAATA
jgi:4-hydroxy-2-oxoheptanedioate aldolase